MDAIEQVLADLNTNLELIESTIEVKKKRKAELKPFLEESATINKKIGELKREAKEIRLHVRFFVDKFKALNGGVFPYKSLPLFADADGGPETEDGKAVTA